MRTVIFLIVLGLLLAASTFGQESKEETKQQKSSNLRQFYSGKFGLYAGSDGLNNGLMIGIDGITEFIHYDFFLSGAIELYPKQTIGIFKNAPPSDYQQSLFLLPLHVNFGYKLFEVGDADSRGYIGAGAGYYFYFYNIDYASGAGGIFGGLSRRSESKNSGAVFGSVFARILIGQIFVEPRFYLASQSEGNVEQYSYIINPSGFAITLGFQYH
jgi:hypothetical protein